MQILQDKNDIIKGRIEQNPPLFFFKKERKN
nr:MAG TPA: hypothetical protein [Crassvirales sp.]